MEKRIKDLTEEELKQICAKNSCGFQCPLYQNNICTRVALKAVTETNFLDREVDIPQPHILDKAEHDYLRAVIKPYDVEYIYKTNEESNSQYITIIVKSKSVFGTVEILSMPCFNRNTMYKGMEVDKKYTIEELELDKEWNNEN